MQKITLTPLAIFDLSVSYARKTAPDKIVHYRLSHGSLMSSMLLGAPNQGPLQFVQDYIREQEGPDIEFEINELPKPKFDEPGPGTLAKGSAMAVEDVTSKVLPHNDRKNRKVRKELEKLAIKSTIHQYKVWDKKTDLVKDTVCHFINYRVFSPLNWLFHKIGTTPIHNEHFIELFPDREIPASGLIPMINSDRSQRAITPMSYLAYGYEEPDEDRAFKALREDLTKLSDAGLILGHLSMPSTIVLADTIGSGHRSKVVFCFLACDTRKLCKILNKNPLELPALPYKLIGINGEQHEGGIEYLEGSDPHKKYQIETVNINFHESEARHKAVIDTYESGKDLVNAIAAGQKAGLSQYEKVSTTSYTEGEYVKDGVDPDTGEEKKRFVAKNVHVNVELKKK